MISKRQYVLTAVLAGIAVVCFFLPSRIGFAEPSLAQSYGALLLSVVGYHFFHANIFHLCINIWGLISFKPRLSTAVVGFLSATVAALCPFCALAEPTFGLSAFLFSCYARSFARYRWPLKKILLPQLCLAFIPHMNWRIHILSFLLSYLFWRIYYDERRR